MRSTLACKGVLVSFKYDAFQEEAIKIIKKEESVFVSAPTGAGKTAIAEYAIEMAMSRNEGVIYTSPIKALSNQKFRDFTHKYENEVGILTGDVSINPKGSLLIMTTEIFRNTLFENPKRFENISWVIFDEIHYLDDPERGTVWEEAIMFTPKHINFLCLSATIPNVDELASWIREVHERPVEVIIEEHRPVKLHHIFQCQNKFFEDMPRLKKQGYENREDWRLSMRDRYKRNRIDRPKAKANRIETLVETLKAEEKLPCIYFTFGRKRCESLALELSNYNFLSDDERSKVLDLFNSLLQKYNLSEERSALWMVTMIERGVAFHHAGMLPTLKEVIEVLFTSKLIKLIFTTETFAIGINMPARTVVFDCLRKYHGTHFGPLKTRDFYQMAGRAGRRGMDKEGFVYTRVNPHEIDHEEVKRIIFRENESVRSQFNTGYATVLNLYEIFGERLLEIYPKSFHAYQSSKRNKRLALELMQSKISLLKDMGYIEKNKISEKGKFASRLYGYELLLGEMQGDGHLDAINPLELCVILAALVYEPRKNDEMPDLHKRFRNVENLATSCNKHVYKKERKFEIHPFTKPAFFHLTEYVEAWYQNHSFEKVMKNATVAEGELVRCFRMIVQLLRQLIHAPNVSDHLKDKAIKAMSRMNRDVVDAEKQLKV